MDDIVKLAIIATVILALAPGACIALDNITTPHQSTADQAPE